MGTKNLNECVDDILRKNKVINSNYKKVIRHNSHIKNKEKMTRFRKNKEQNNILLAIYDNNSNWDKDMIQKLSDQLSLKESQIYKWHWDQRKK